MRKNLKRVLERLRAASGGARRRRTSVRRGLQAPQRFTAQPAPARAGR